MVTADRYVVTYRLTVGKWLNPLGAETESVWVDSHLNAGFLSIVNIIKL